MKETLQAYATIIISTCICILIALASAQGSLISGSFPVLFLCIGVIFIIQWLVFIPSYYWSTERFYDLTGSLTFITVALIAFYNKNQFLGNEFDLRSIAITVFILIWALRLGSYLFLRILKDREDRRFKEWKTSFPLFLRTWTMQGMWIFLTSVSGITAICSRNIIDPGTYFYIGCFLWIFGFSFESISDYQKRKFKVQNPESFISSGLWSLSRHPNYFGEIVLWLGITIIAFPVLQGYQYFSLISPIFVFWLLTKVSGIPILERHADETWGGQEGYKKYKESTPVLIPKFFK